jgi:hypothetical protein
MTTADFFADFNDAHYSEFVEHELSKIFQCATTQEQFFEFDDLPQ